MNKKITAKILSYFLALSLTGCGVLPENASPVSSTPKESSIPTNNTEVATSSMITETVPTTVDYEEEQRKAEEEKRRKEEEERQRAEEERRKAEEEKKLAEQRNSYSMLYHLAITAEEICTSKDNRVALEEIYTSLLNDINPGSIDEETQDHLQALRDIIKTHMNIATKRERLQYIYNQEKASAIRNAVPNPLSVLSVSNVTDWKKLALAVTYTAVDSYNNYKKSSESADMSYFMSGWELEDEEKEAVSKNRDRAFNYMVDMVQKYNLDGSKTLNIKMIEDFAEICAIEYPAEKISRLKAEEATYSLLGNYWLELASAYFDCDQYKECLECVEKYKALSIGIYRKDYNYLKILPKAIVAAQNVYSGTQYETAISQFAADIKKNAPADDWSSLYFAAQVYLDLYSRTNKTEYLDESYEITHNNVVRLLGDQRELNTTYLNNIDEKELTEKLTADLNPYMSDSERKAENDKIKKYINALKATRETELPSLYEPLIVNCELMFAIADKKDFSSKEKKNIEAELLSDTCGNIIVKPINNAYSFTHTNDKPSGIDFEKDKISIPVEFLSAGSEITVKVNEGGTSNVFEDCVVSSVNRQGTEIKDFTAVITSKSLKKYKWTADSKIELTIKYGDAYDKTINFNFAVSKYDKHWYGDKVVFAEQ